MSSCSHLIGQCDHKKNIDSIKFAMTTWFCVIIFPVRPNCERQVDKVPQCCPMTSVLGGQTARSCNIAGMGIGDLTLNSIATKHAGCSRAVRCFALKRRKSEECQLVRHHTTPTITQTSIKHCLADMKITW
jgi:hypothetical protein